MTAVLRILSGGAANGLAGALGSAFEAAMGCRIAGTYGAVGAMRDRLVAGEPADLVILTPALIAALTHDGRLVPGSAAGIGIVRTGIAVRRGVAAPPVADAGSLRAALLAADAIYYPDPKLATAGIHVAKMLDALAIAGAVAQRLKAFANGQTAMAAMAAGADRQPIGITQVTEILNTAGVSLIAPLPPPFELATLYTAAVTASAAAPDLARRFIAHLAAADTAGERARCGFE